MSEFNTIDLMNYAVYGNDFDPEWSEIRKYIEADAEARKEFEEIKRTLLQRKSSSSRERSYFKTESDNEEKKEDKPPEKKGLFGLF